MKFFQSTIGLKITMALSGLVLVGFVIGHMLGNLQIFLPDGKNALNDYATMLHKNAPLLWGARVVLLASVLAHITSAVKLVMRSSSARPKQYSQRGWLGASYATRTMKHGGFILLAFIIFHLLHLTGAQLGDAKEACNAAGECTEVYNNVVSGFSGSNAWIAIFYMIAQVFLGLHLTHGIHSAARSLGIANPKRMRLAEKTAVAVGMLIMVGNISIPLAVLLGIISK